MLELPSELGAEAARCWAAAALACSCARCAAAASSAAFWARYDWRARSSSSWRMRSLYLASASSRASVASAFCWSAASFADSMCSALSSAAWRAVGEVLLLGLEVVDGLVEVVGGGRAGAQRDPGQLVAGQAVGDLRRAVNIGPNPLVPAPM